VDPVDVVLADGGTVRLRPINPDDGDAVVALHKIQHDRERRAEAVAVSRLLAPRSIAVYGVRADGTGVGAALVRHVRAARRCCTRLSTLDR